MGFSKAVPVDVVDIATAVSEKVCDVFPSYIRAVRVLNSTCSVGEGNIMTTPTTTIEVSGNSSTSTIENGDPVGSNVDSFWPDDCHLSDDKKCSYFWQFHRSRGCHEYTTIMAKVLKDLCDDDENGILLTHNGRPVINILVLNTTEFDVSDLLDDDDSSVLRIKDPVSNVTLPIVATHEIMERLCDLDKEICCRLGMENPEKINRVPSELKRARPESYSGSVPHWWIAVVVKEERKNYRQFYEMIHLDICGAAYDPTALVTALPRVGKGNKGEGNADNSNELLVPLTVFRTPQYAIEPNTDKSLSHKFLMKAFINNDNINESSVKQTPRIVLQPKSIRHFRCYHKDDTSSVEVTPLPTFIERNLSGTLNDSMKMKIDEMLQSLRRDINIWRLPVGTKVVVCNIQSKPELNGRSGVITKYTTERDKTESDDRIPVLIEGKNRSLSLKLTCIRLNPVARGETKQYCSLQEMRQKCEESLDDSNPLEEEEEEKERTKIERMSNEQKSQTLDALSSDPDVSKALSVIQTGQLSFTSFGDPEIKRGLELLLKPPLDVILPSSFAQKLGSGIELSNHPKADTAMKLINLLKSLKQRCLEEHPDCINPDGSLAILPGSDMMRIQMNVVKKVRNDEQLHFVFQRLEELGLYHNPAR